MLSRINLNILSRDCNCFGKQNKTTTTSPFGEIMMRTCVHSGLCPLNSLSLERKQLFKFACKFITNAREGIYRQDTLHYPYFRYITDYSEYRINLFGTTMKLVSRSCYPPSVTLNLVQGLICISYEMLK